jgi:protein Mpv17
MQRQMPQFWKRITAIKDRIHRVYHNSPKLANAVTGFATFAAGDLIVQRYEFEKWEQINVRRSVELGMLGVIMNGYFLVSWYRLLDKVVGISMTSYSAVSLKVISDQVIFAPFSILAFFGFSALIRFKTWNEICDYFNYKMKHNFWTTFFADCSIWPVANLVNFRYITLPFRPSFTAVIQLMWQIYLSAVAEKKKNQEKLRV